MAIQFPNFLSAPIQKPDYSGLADIVQNYYGGKALKKDDLLKQIQAEFARPTAEETLQGLKLGNQGSILTNQGAGLTNEKARLDIAKFRRDQAIEQALQSQLMNALKGVGTTGTAPAQQMPAMQPQPQQQINPALTRLIQQQFQQNAGGSNAPTAPTAPSFMPNASTAPTASASQQPMEESPASQAPSSKMQVITEGAPHLANVDALWDQNPLSREFLKKKGFDKKTDIKFDQKTGQTRVITTYPSGKTTLEVIGGSQNAEGIPLTNKMVSTHQRVISSVDNVLPTLRKLKDMDTHSNIYAGDFTATHNQKKYQRLVNAAKESLIGAFALNPTEAGLQTAIDQLTIGGFESEKDYKEAIQDLINDLEAKKQYSATEVKRSNKIQPISRSDSSNQTYSSDEWENTNE